MQAYGALWGLENTRGRLTWISGASLRADRNRYQWNNGADTEDWRQMQWVSEREGCISRAS